MNRTLHKTGIILAGGKSSRMGTEKGLVVFKNKALIQYAIEILLDLCDEILISTSSSAYSHLGYPIVSDLIPDSGPMIGIYSSLLVSKNEDNLVLSCDMPFVTPRIFGLLEDAGRSASICVPCYENDHYEPLCGVYKRSALKDFERFIEKKNFKLPDLYKEAYFSALKVNDLDPPLPKHYFLNINSRDDLFFAEKISKH
jgi:molybdopterin-guanine dinucleotide biosynthesis protein A